MRASWTMAPAHSRTLAETRPGSYSTVAALFVLGAFADKAEAQSPPDWTEPYPPFRIAEHLY